MRTIPIFVGIDVSAKDLHVAWREEKNWHQQTIANHWPSVEAFAAHLVEQLPNAHCIIEHTGTYSSKIVEALCAVGLPVSLISPKQSKGFSQMKHRITKNDRSDARALADFGQCNAGDLPLWRPCSDMNLHRRQLLERIHQLEKMRQQVAGQRHAQAQLPPHQQREEIFQSFDQLIEVFDRQIKDLTEQRDALDQHDEDLCHSYELLTSIKGIGHKTAQIINDTTGGVKQFDSPKALSKYAGLAPTECQSGSSVRGRARINRSGNAKLRTALYCASWSAVKHNTACRALYQRLRAKGKAAKVALIAVCNLLVRQIYAVITTDTPFDNHYADQQLAIQT